MVSRRIPTPLGIGRNFVCLLFYAGLIWLWFIENTFHFIEFWSIESIFRAQLLHQSPKVVRCRDVSVSVSEDLTCGRRG